MPRQDQIERAGRERPDDDGEVTQQDSEWRAYIDQRVGPRAPAAVGVRIDPDERDRKLAELDGRLLVAQERSTLEIVELRRTGERISRDGDVVITEYDVRPLETREELAQPTLTARMGHQIAGHADEIGPASRDPVDRLSACPIAP